MDLSNFMQFVDTYGSSAVVIGVAIWGIYELIKTLLRFISKTDERIEIAESKKDEANEHVISILKELLENKEQEEKARHQIACTNRKHVIRLCSEYIEMIKKETGADCVSIHDYCNGSNSLTGIPFLHFRVIAKRDDDNIRRNSVIGSKYAIEMLGQFLLDLEDKKFIIIKSLNKELSEKYPELIKEMRYGKKHKGVFCDIKNNGLSVGFMNVTFKRSTPVDFIHVQEVMAKYSALLADLLGNSQNF